MRKLFLILYCLRCLLPDAYCQFSETKHGEEVLIWEKLASFLTEEIQLGKRHGAFYGSHNGAVIIAGGTTYQVGDTSQWPFQQWVDQVVVLDKNEVGNYIIEKPYVELPFGPLAYGAAISTQQGLVCAGGISPEGVRKEAFIISWDNIEDTISIRTLPSLPKPLAFISGVSAGSQIYLLGGSSQVSPFETTNDFLSLDLSIEAKAKRWETLPSWNGSGRILPLTSIQNDGLNDGLYLFGGINLVSDQSIDLLPDSYQFNFKEAKWKKLDENNQTFKLLPNSAKALGTADIISLGVSNNSISNKIFLYHTITDTWRPIGQSSFTSEMHPIPHADHHLLVLSQKEEKVELHAAKVMIQNQKLGWLNILILILYFLLLIYLGFYFSSKQKSAEDYFKGGKRIPWWAAGLSLYGTGLSAISFMAVPAKTYATDWAYFMTKLPQLLIPIIVSILFIPFYRKLDITTAYEYLQKRFNLATRLVGSLSFIIFQLGRIGIILYLPAIALNVATGIDIILCILVMGGISLIYTIMGGIEAVIWTDVLQVIILIGGIILCLIIISFNLEGGFKEVVNIGIENQKFEILNMAFDWTQPTFWVVVLSGFFSNLITYSTDQTMVQRYLTTKDTKAAKRSIWTNTLVSLSIGWIFFFVGTALFSYYKAKPDDLLPGMSSNDAIFPWYIISQLPNGISGLLIAGIFAAAMSSLSSSMNSAATAYTVDFHRVFQWRGDELKIGRLATLVIGLAGISFAILFATMNVKSIWDEFLKIIGLITGGLGGVFLLGIISKRANGVGALTGLFGSGVIQFLMATYQPIHFLLYTASGFLSCLLIGYFTSLLFPKFNKPIDGLTIFT